MDEHAPECRFVPSGTDGCQGLLYAGSVCHLVQMSDMACCEQVSAIWCRWMNMHVRAGLCHLVQMGCQGLLYAGSVCHLVQMSDMACCEQVSAIWCRWMTMILECWFVPSGTDG